VRGRDDGARRRGARIAFVAGLVVAAAIMLVGWNKVAASPELCSTCHSMGDSVASSGASVHRGVPCLACHTGPGLTGALRYLPTFVREGAATLTGWNLAHGVLKARPCESCHLNLRTAAVTRAAHSGRQACETCHGNVAHPAEPIAPRPVPQASGDPHPADFVQLHGQQVAASPGACSQCHQSTFCQACHFKSTYPHPDNWIPRHGRVEQLRGVQACTLCHPPTFCAGCHGTDIPHDPNWLGEHWRALQDASTSPCLVCHPRTDCTTCHAEHSIHREQDLYRRPA
jgi:hypothetical protein